MDTIPTIRRQLAEVGTELRDITERLQEKLKAESPSSDTEDDLKEADPTA
jgi:hypothetical protein